ncbi:MAG: nucleotide exchange factor GrpE, partial [Hyphomicrobium sp.]
MSDDKKPIDDDTIQSRSAPPESGEVGIEQLKAMIGALQADLEKKSAELAAKQDQYLRAVAETENVRRRLEKEKEETAKYAITRFARDVVTVADNFERAVQAVPQGAAEEDAALKSLVEGVTMTERELMNVLERYGVKRISPKGEMFNPHQHQAMM